MKAKTYTIKDQVRGEYRAPLAGGLIEICLDAGPFVPKTPAECELAEHLVEIGAAELDAPAKRTKRGDEV